MNHPPGRDSSHPNRVLTTREYEIFLRLLNGQSVKAVAEELFISPQTLKSHLTQIRMKLGVRRTAQIRSHFSQYRKNPSCRDCIFKQTILSPVFGGFFDAPLPRNEGSHYNDGGEAADDDEAALSIHEGRNAMASKQIRRMVSFDVEDYRVIQQVAEQKGLGWRGFSAALRLIIREWSQLQAKGPFPVAIAPTSPTQRTQEEEAGQRRRPG